MMQRHATRHNWKGSSVYSVQSVIKNSPLVDGKIKTVVDVVLVLTPA